MASNGHNTYTAQHAVTKVTIACCRSSCQTSIVLAPAAGVGSDPTPSASQPPPSSTGPPQELPQAVVLLSIAQQMLLDQGKMLDTARLAAFSKKLSCVALHLESGAALGSLSLVNRLLRFVPTPIDTFGWDCLCVP